MKTKFSSVAAVLIGAIVLSLVAGGCSTTLGAIGINTKNSRNLRVGMTKEQVKKIMGEPITNEKFCQPNIWYYYHEMVWGDGLVTEDECMPLVFENGKLIGWGNNFRIDYELKRKNAELKHNPDQEKKP